MVDRPQLVSRQQLPDTYYRTLGVSLASLLIVAFVALVTSCLPQRAVTMSDGKPPAQLSLQFEEINNTASARGEACPNQRFLETARIAAEIEANSAAPVTLVTCEGSKADVNSQSPASPAVLEWKALPPDLIVGPYTLAEVELARKTGSLKFFPARVMARLQQAEAHEVDRHLREDYRQAWITVSFLQKDVPNAFVQASYRMYGLHPLDVWPSIVADRKARLGAEYHDFYDSADNLRPDVPRIPPAADNHAANGADSANWDGTLGPIPTKERTC